MSALQNDCLADLDDLDVKVNQLIEDGEEIVQIKTSLQEEKSRVSRRSAGQLKARAKKWVDKKTPVALAHLFAREEKDHEVAMLEAKDKLAFDQIQLFDGALEVVAACSSQS